MQTVGIPAAMYSYSLTGEVAFAMSPCIKGMMAQLK